MAVHQNGDFLVCALPIESYSTCPMGRAPAGWHAVIVDTVSSRARDCGDCPAVQCRDEATAPGGAPHPARPTAELSAHPLEE
jgi:hypothetical protein